MIDLSRNGIEIDISENKKGIVLPMIAKRLSKRQLQIDIKCQVLLPNFINSTT